MRLRKATRLLASTALIFAACVLASCSSGGASSSSPEAGGSGTDSSESQSASAVRFDSPEYGYSITIPSSWTANEAHTKWDGRSELTSNSFGADVFVGPPPVVSFAAAARWKRGLASYARFLIATTVRYHSDTCPTRPDRQKRITIGGRPGVLLEYNCGILINIAATVRQGVGYMFVFKDDSVQAASDPTDHAVFAQMLSSVEFTP